MSTVPGLRLGPGEEVVYVLRTHLKVLFLPAMIQLLLTACLVSAWMFIPADLGEGWVRYGAMIAVGIAMLHYAVWPVLQWRNNRFIVTTSQILVQEGVIYKKTHSSKLARATDIRCERGILDRIFRCGTIVVINAANTHTDAAADLNRIVFRDVPGALEIEQKLKDMVWNEIMPTEAAA